MSKYNNDSVKVIVNSTIGLGNVVAAMISWSMYPDYIWGALWRGWLGWIYVIYHFFTR